MNSLRRTSPWLSQPLAKAMSNPDLGSRVPIVVLAGPPASGKGTQCEYVVKFFHYIHLSVGDLLRASAKQHPDIAGFQSRGELVPDALTIRIVLDRLAAPDCTAAKGVILDGFPRTLAQAQALDQAGVHIQQYLSLQVPDETIVSRISGRRTDPGAARLVVGG